MTDSFWSNLAGIITAISLLVTAVFTFWTHIKVGRVEAQTDGMLAKMETSAKKEGKAEEKQEQAERVSGGPAIPLVVASGANQDEIVKFVAQGIAQGILMEKTRRAAEGNGPKGPA